MSRSLFVRCLLLCACATPLHAQSTRRVADLILTDGKVFTADSTHPWAEAVAIRGVRIMAVGTTVEMRRLAARATRVVSLGGRVVIPGINDAHIFAIPSQALPGTMGVLTIVGGRIMRDELARVTH